MIIIILHIMNLLLRFIQNNSLLRVLMKKQRILERQEVEEYIDKLKKTINPDKMNNLIYLSSNLFPIFLLATEANIIY